jgi:hypothetical protein
MCNQFNKNKVLTLFSDTSTTYLSNCNKKELKLRQKWLILTSWILLEKSPIAPLLKNFLKFCGTRKFITVFTRIRHWSLSRTRWIQSILHQHISLRCIFVLSLYLRQGLLTCLFPLVFSVKRRMHSFSPPWVLHSSPFSPFLTLLFQLNLAKSTNYKTPLYDGLNLSLCYYIIYKCKG